MSIAADQLRFAAPDDGLTHALLTGLTTLCRMTVDPRDVYEDRFSGEYVWREFSEGRCPECEARLEAGSEGEGSGDYG